MKATVLDVGGQIGAEIARLSAWLCEDQPCNCRECREAGYLLDYLKYEAFTFSGWANHTQGERAGLLSCSLCGKAENDVIVKVDTDLSNQVYVCPDCITKLTEAILERK